MKVNVGVVDRVLRVLVGLGLIAWVMTDGPAWAWAGVLLLFTGSLGFCPVYPLLGLDTTSRRACER